ncbi:hypothetical protein ACFL1J_00615 [Pseudomonadota bacterium]
MITRFIFRRWCCNTARPFGNRASRIAGPLGTHRRQVLAEALYLIRFGPGHYLPDTSGQSNAD